MLAHNAWSIWVDLNTAEIMSEIQKITDENKTLGLGEVREFRDAARKLASSFEYASGELRFSSP